jgi:hypothetical protein
MLLLHVHHGPDVYFLWCGAGAVFMVHADAVFGLRHHSKKNASNKE